MRKIAFLFAALLPVSAFAQASASDLAYCNRLADTYERYVGRAELSSNRGVSRGSIDGEVASAQCRAGRPGPAIPVLEQVLRNNGFTLPPRG
jgi:hypothetical protein